MALVAQTATTFDAPEGYLGYVPEKTEYGFEFGSMWESNNLYWISGTFGKHVGRCLLSQKQTCQQYIDFIFGVGGRDGLTLGNVFVSPRWQYVSFPSHVSPYFRLLGGAKNIRDDFRDITTGSGGIGIGVATAAHENLDLKLETRIGYSDQVWSQVMIVFSFKVQSWVDHFSEKLKKLGVSTIEETRRIFKSNDQQDKEDGKDN